ncbi:MAG: DUF4907 domain-containing protein [Bacteroidia bacterium]
MTQKISSIKLMYSIFGILIMFSACSGDSQKQSDSKSADSSVATVRNEAAGGMNEGENGNAVTANNQSYEVNTFSNTADIGGFGYDVLMGGKLYIHQPHIPAIQGNKGFANEANARKAGEFIVSKLKRNIMPPSVSKEELDSLGVL